MLQLTIRVLITAIAVLALAASASYATVPVALPVEDVNYGPTLSGDALIYGKGRLPDGSRGFVDIYRQPPGVSPQRIFTFDVGGQVDLAASDQAFVAADGEVHDCSDGGPPEMCLDSAHFAAGTVGGLGATLNGCMPSNVEGNGGFVFTQPLVAADGQMVALPVDTKATCGQHSRIELRVAGATEAQQILPISGFRLEGVALAGRYLAAVTATRKGAVVVTLFDWQTKALVYTKAFIGRAPVDIGIDVQADGTVALSSKFFKRSGKKTKPLCRSAAAIVTLSLDGGQKCTSLRPATTEVKLSDDTLAAYVRRGKWVDTLIARNIRSGSTQNIRTTADSEFETFDFDGKRFGWLDQSCHNNFPVIAEFSPDLVTSQTRCPMRVSTRTLVLHKFRGTTIPFTCPNGCSGVWEITGPRAIGPESPIHDDQPMGSYLVGISYEPVTEPYSLEVFFDDPTTDYLKKHRPKKIALTWTSDRSSLDGTNHSRTFTFKVKYRR